VTVAKVVDASAVAAVIFVEPRAEEASSLIRGSRLYAPVLIEYELSNVCVKKCRQFPGQQAALLVSYAGRTSLPIHLVAVDHAGVTDLALRTGLSSYDATYLWLALRLNLELVTFDKELGKAAQAL
jgi:predicted nucleic acid-binding protein